MLDLYLPEGPPVFLLEWLDVILLEALVESLPHLGKGLDLVLLTLRQLLLFISIIVILQDLLKPLLVGLLHQVRVNIFSVVEGPGRNGHPDAFLDPLLEVRLVLFDVFGVAKASLCVHGVSFDIHSWGFRLIVKVLWSDPHEARWPVHVLVLLLALLVKVSDLFPVFVFAQWILSDEQISVWFLLKLVEFENAVDLVTEHGKVVGVGVGDYVLGLSFDAAQDVLER